MIVVERIENENSLSIYQWLLDSEDLFTKWLNENFR